MKELLTVKANVDLILGVEPEKVKREEAQELSTNNWLNFKKMM